MPRPNLGFIEQPGPGVCHQFFSLCAARIPFFRPFNESLGDRILLDVASNEFKLLCRLYASVVVAILPSGLAALQKCCGYPTNIAHHIVHKFGEDPSLVQSKQSMPMIGHDHERTEIDTLLLNRKSESADDEFACSCV